MEKLSDHLYIPPMGDVLAERAREQEKAKKTHKRSYAAARVNRLNADWVTTPYSANWSIYRDNRILRARARQMAKDAPHFKKFLAMCRSNIVGPKGIQLQVNAMLGKRAHTTLNSKVEAAWWEWCFSENCSVSGKLNFVAMQNLLVDHIIRDGEALVQLVDAGPFGLQLKFWNVDYLDETYNEELRDGHRIIMSVEIDANGKPIAYHLTTPASDINFTPRRVRQRVRIPAEQIIHAFIVTDDESQIRGVTWFAAGMLEGKNLESYKQGVIMSARMAANTFGFLEKEEPDEVEFTGEDDEEGVEQDIEIDSSPLAINELPHGYKFNPFDPKQPTQNHAEFHRTILHDIAAAFGVNYFSLAGDMASVNYSSARVGLREERDLWKSLQEVVSTLFCRRVYHVWLRAALLSGKLDLSPRDFMNVQNPKWCPRGWSYVDPQKEVKANVEALANNLTTLTDVLAEQGIDLVEHFETIQKERTLAEEYKIELKYGQQAPEAKQPDDGGDDTEEGTAKPQDDGERGYSNGKYLS